MEESAPRDRDSIALELIGVAGLTAFLLGLVTLQTSHEVGFDAGAALTGILDQLSVTLPAAVLVLAASALDLAAGLVLARLARNRAFESIADALVAAMVAAVLKDAVLLGVLGGVGLFRAPILVGLNAALIAAAWVPRLALHLRPLGAWGPWRDAAATLGPWPVAALLVLVWSGPVVLQLASPAVPFIDVLPNHVGPVEHLRAFGWLSPLTATQSPIYGPSRSVLGYDGLLGSIATIANIPAATAIAGFILPQTILVAAGAHRLATAVTSHAGIVVGPWALLAFAIAQPFARLGDVRGTVVVVPLVCLGLAFAADLLRQPAEHPGSDDQSPPEPWRIGRGTVIGLAFGAAALVHPVIAFFGIVTVGITAVIRPRALAAPVVVAGIVAMLVALPQLATMIGISLPSIALGVVVVLATVAGIAAERTITSRARLRNLAERSFTFGRLILVAVIALGIAVGVDVEIFRIGRLPSALAGGLDVVLTSSGILLLTMVAGLALGSVGARSSILLAGLVVGAAAVGLAGLLQRDLGLLGDALRFEIPKTVHYWLSTIAAAGAAAALAFAWSKDRLPLLARAGTVGAFVVVAALPIRAEPIDAYHLGEHRYSETFAIDLRWAGRGFWLGYPDLRTIVDPPRQEILDAVRAEIAAGRLLHDTKVLHLASSFQQWVATPVGALAGVHETFVSLDPENSHHTVGGRLYGLDALAGFLGSGEFGYVLLEPDGLPGELLDQIVSAGYAPIFGNAQGELFAAVD